MTQREKKLLGILVVLGIVMGGGILSHLMIWQPLTELWAQNATETDELLKKQEDLAKEERQIEAILKTSPRLALWQKTSLPPRDPQTKPKPGVGPEEAKKRHLAHLQVEYERYLSELLRRSEFDGDSITITARPPERGSGPGAKSKEATYDRLVFAITGKAKLEGVVQMLHDFHRTNLLHQVRTINLASNTPRGPGLAGGLTPGAGGLGQRPGFGGGGAQRPGLGVGQGRPGQSSTGELEVNMTVEALVVSGAEERSALIASTSTVKPRVLAEPIRSYREMTARHMFLGLKREEDDQLSEEKKEVLRFVRLTTISHNGRRWEGYLYDLGKGGEERRINAVTLDQFSILDQYENPMLSARVVKIDERNLVIQVEGKFYRLQVGDFFYPALDTPLTPAQMHELDVSPES